MSDAREPRPSDASHPSAWAALPRTCGACRADTRHSVAISGPGTYAPRGARLRAFLIRTPSMAIHSGLE
jgi:hypothetical protein